MATSRSIGPKQVLRLVVGIGIGGVFAYLAFRHMDWAQTWSAISSANPLWIVAALGLLAGDYVLRITRWKLMLRAVSADVSFGEAAVPYLASIGLNNVLPFRLGDVARAVGYCRFLKASTGQIISTMVVERLLDLLSLLGIFFVLLQFVPPGRVSPLFVQTCGAVVLVGVVMLLTLLLAPQAFQLQADRMAAKSKNPKVQRVAGWFSNFFESLLLMRSGSLALKLVLLSAGAWILEGGVFAAVAAALGQHNLGGAPWFALSTGTLGTLVPSTPGYVGTFDFFCLLGFTAFGASSQASSLAVLVIHAVLWIPLTLVGLLLFGLTSSRRISQGGITATPVGEGA